MRFKALLALLGLGLALMLIAGCSDSEDNNRIVSGVISNASTGLPVGAGAATVTLFQNGVQVRQPVTTNADGRFTFKDVKKGSNYTVVVASTAVPPAFQTVTSNTFTVENNINNLDIAVGSGLVSTVSGTITNAATGLPLGAGEANVRLFQNGTQVGTTQQTTAAGGFSFAGVQPGSNYTIVVTSTASPEAFEEVTTSAFSVTGDTTQNVTVGAAGTETVTGIIGTSVAGASFTVVAKNAAGQVVAQTTTTDVAGIPNFTLTNVPIGTVTLEATSTQVPGVITVLPLTVPQGGVSGLIFNVQDAAGLANNGVPDTANLVAFIPGSGTITVDSTVSTAGNPTFLTVANGTYTVTVTPTSGTAVVVPNVTVSAGNVTVIRLPEFAV